MTSIDPPNGVQVLGEVRPEWAEILTPDALQLVATLQREFGPRREELLAKRVERSQRIEAGEKPDFLPETKHIREDDSWRIAPEPDDLQDRRAEITGPVDRKMIINALNSGAKVFMADFEDANTPVWENNMNGQVNLRDANARSISFKQGEKTYELGEELATLIVRPRGWHLYEKHVLVDGVPVSGGIMDFALYLFHNHEQLAKNGSGPYFYLPKLESHLEARLWNDIFVKAQQELGIPQGTIKATVLIETILAAFEMDEILYELREHSAGLNCGRWDYIFSFIKTFRNQPEFALPDRGQVGMTQPFMAAYSQLVIKTCHKRGVHAMGGMAAQIPIKTDQAANEAAIAKVRADKEREVKAGHDGTWVAHPGLIATAREQFDAHIKGSNQIDNPRDDVNVSAADLIAIPQGTRTDDGLRQNVRVGIQYLEAWLGGNGCVPLYHLMEDAATAEISRAQVWQWAKHGVDVGDGPVTAERLRTVIDEELARVRTEVGDARFDAGKFDLARELFERICTADELPDFLTLVAYDHITTVTQ